jgi:hypothetical protein
MKWKKHEPLDLSAARELLRGSVELVQQIAEKARGEEADALFWWQVQRRLVPRPNHTGDPETERLNERAGKISELHWHLEKFPEDTEKKLELEKLREELCAEAEAECEALGWKWPTPAGRE